MAKCLLFVLPNRIANRIRDNTDERQVYVLHTSSERTKRRMTLIEGVFATLLFDMALFGTKNVFIDGIIRLFTSLQNSWDKPFQSKQQADVQITEFCERLGIQQNPWIWEKDKQSYTCLNDFFARTYAENHFPQLGEDAQVVSPACCTLTRYADNVELQNILIKGCHYELSKVGLPSEDLPLYKKNTVFLGYLSPSDYHRVHAPIEGTCIHCQMEDTQKRSASVKFFGGKFNILNDNRRLVIVLESKTATKVMNRVALVIVGGIGVDTIVYDRNMLGKDIKKGQELSTFRAGGSAVAMFSTRPLELLPKVEQAYVQYQSVEVLVGESLANML